VFSDSDAVSVTVIWQNRRQANSSPVRFKKLVLLAKVPAEPGAGFQYGI
jgi:hypothetical protein